MAENALSTNPRDDQGKLVLRLAIGALILMHGIAKLGGNVDWIAGMLGKAGLPSVLAYGVYLGEVIAPLLLIAGVWTRAAALVIAVNMLFAIGLVHTGDIGRITEVGAWGIETQALFLFGALAIALLGAGRLSFGGAGGRWN
ncbi:MAG TPA: DoxX family protein [Quisquiliibacterium sp.]|nr:DoxX family protein [Quisquiliibacterium sp.]